MFLNFEEFNNKKVVVRNETSLKCIHVNIRSCRQNWDISQVHIQYSKVPWDVIVFTETNIKDEETSLYNIDDCDQIYVCRKNTRGGGILIFEKKKKFTNVSHEIKKLDINEIIDVKLERNEEMFNLVVMYRKPSSSRIQFLKDLKNLFVDIENIHKEKKTNVIMMGDLNLNILKHNIDKSEKYDVEKFENVLAYFGYSQQIETETREELRQNVITSSCIDLIFTKLCNTFCKGYVVKQKPADHYYTILEVWTKDKEDCENKIITKHRVQLNAKQIIRQLQNINWDNLDNEKSK